MYFRSSTKKAVQAACVLLEQTPSRSMSYLRLLKLLYVADRKAMESVHRPIIGTRVVAMRNGPLHSEVFNLIKKEHIDEPLWSEFIRKEGYLLTEVKDPGVSELSRFEISVLTSVSEEFSQVDDWQLVEHTHCFPEWKKHYPDPAENTSQTFPLEDILDALGLAAEKSAILADAWEDSRIRSLQAQVSRV